MQLVTFSECGNRWENQDYFRTEIMAEQTVLIVCDGVGGSRYGAISSKTVCDVIADFWSRNTVGSDWKKKVQEACKRASEALDKKSDECQCKDMGTTMVMAIVKDSQVTIVHCGDSRCYLLRPEEGVIYQTKDHLQLSFGWEVLVNTFFSYKGNELVPEVYQFDLKPGDRLFLCTDGVYKSVKSEFLIPCLMGDKNIETIADVVKSLCEKNMDDNYTGVLYQYMREIDV